jgi:SH3-like domain-containing protein
MSKGVTTGNVKMRSGPGMEFEPPIAYLEPNTEVEVLGEEKGWWKVHHKNKDGYIGHKWLKVEEAKPAATSPGLGNIPKDERDDKDIPEGH